LATVTRTVTSNNANIDGLLTEYQWSRFTPYLTFGIPRKGAWSGYSDPSEPYFGYGELTSAQTSAVTRILTQDIRGITGMFFLELYNEATTIPESEKPQNADLRFGRTLWGPTDDFFVAFSYTPHPETVGASSGTADKLSGDVWIWNDDADTYPGSILSAPQTGNYEYFTLLHEIGHAMGMKHPHEVEGQFGIMPAATDQLSYTVMSYRSYQGQSVDGDGYTNGDWDFPQTYMIWDIAAFQHMYGANYSTNGSDTVYTWDSATGQSKINGSTWLAPGGNKVFLTIWDGGGNDTYDLSAYTTNLSIDLNPEAWSTISTAQLADLGDGHFAPGNIANARLYQNNIASLIENAIGGSGNDSLIGNQAVNRLTGNAGDDLLDGRVGADILTGGLGSDRYIVDNVGDVIVEALDEGDDRVETSVSYTLSANIERLTSTIAAGLTLTGNDIANTITGGIGNDIIDGKGGADLMIGGVGNDTYFVDDAGDVIDDAGGTDTIVVSTSYVLVGDVIENITLGGSASINATGNGLANTITGNAGDNILDGAGGVDVLAGLGGNDIYIIDTLGEAVEGSNAGVDEIRTSFASFTLGTNFENLTGLGASGQTLTGNGVANVITGTAFDDFIDGGIGADTMIGGAGDDHFTVDNAGDLIVELAGGGSDTVVTSSSYVLGAEIEKLTLLGSAAINGTGNAVDNLITGNGSGNILDGGAGADILDGGLGNDIYIIDALDQIVDSGGIDEVRVSAASYTLVSGMENLTGLSALGQSLTGNSGANVVTGAGGNDLIDGGTGADTLRGGLGDDIYLVDLSSDNVVELAGEGNDEVRTSIFIYTLGANIERFTALSAGGQWFTGNGLDNVLTGNAGADRLDGGIGNDILIGGLGDDLYTVDALDIVVELAGEGIDSVMTSAAAYTLAANVESLFAMTSAGQSLTGNDLANSITGGGGNDILDGAGGADTLNGGAGSDIFYVGEGDSVGEASGSAGTDEVRTALAAYTLAANVENLTGTSGSGQALTGNDLDNLIQSGSGNDVIDGGLGADNMIGGLGNDIYVIDNGADMATELDNAGIDGIRTNLASFSLAGFANIENLTGGNGNQSLTGNGWNNIIDGGFGADSMAGGGGHDVYIVDDNGDTIAELDGAGTDEVRTILASFSIAPFANVENLTGGAGDQSLTGNGWNNIIDGGAGADAMAGGGGHDVYIVDNLGDTVTELDGAGIDEVRTSLGSKAAPDYALYVLPDFVENLTGTSAGAQGVRGNSLDNVIVMGGGADLIVLENGGVDNVNAGGGNDFIYYGAAWTSADVTNGGSGSDTVGFLGNYTLTFTATNFVGMERLALYTGGGTNSYNVTLSDDNVVTSTDFFVTAASLNASEILTFNGSAETGARFTILGGSGADTITAGAANDYVAGNAGNDTLYGLGGTDTLFGGAGADQLFGGAGQDFFRYQATSESMAGGMDQILDFTVTDRIDLSAIDAKTGGANDAFTFIGDSAFHNIAGELRAYQSGADWFVEGDVNGDGIADLMIQLNVIDSSPIVAGNFIF
jgi:serralysin